MRFRVSAFADEASEALDGQLEALHEAGIDCLEIRGVDGKNISKVTAAEAKELRRRFDDAGIAVSSIGSPYGKIKVADDFAPHLEELKASLEVADILGARYLRMFSFFLDGKSHEECRDTVFERLDRMLETAAGSGVLFCHENEKGIYGDRAVYCEELMQAFGDRMGCVYDPANFLQCGDDAYAAFERLRPYITYFHIKDVIRDGGTMVPAGEGDARIPQMLEVLREEERTAFITVEPHLQVFKGLAELEEDGGAAMRHKYQYASNRESFSAAAAALLRCLSEAGYRAQLSENVRIWTTK